MARDARSKFFLEAEVTQTGTISEDLKNPEDQTDLDVFFYVVVKPERAGANFSFDILTDKVVMMSLGVILIIIGLTFLSTTFALKNNKHQSKIKIKLTI